MRIEQDLVEQELDKPTPTCLGIKGLVVVVVVVMRIEQELPL
jgi:hypothetical protein